MGLRRPPRDLHDHLDGDAVVAILALQLLESNSEKRSMLLGLLSIRTIRS